MPTPPAPATGHVSVNRALWSRWSRQYAEMGRRAWASNEPTWGIWNVPEREVRAVPDVAGRDVVELGCGTAYWSAWLARRGARPVGVDASAEQLATARALQREFGLEFPLVQASAEAVPLADASFDLAFSEYGAATWCDPRVWIPEAARLLRRDGQLVFLKNGTLLVLCMREHGAAGVDLRRPAFGMHRLDWTAQDDGVTFDLSWGEWIRLFRSCRFEIEDLIEIRVAADGAPSPFDFVTREWASRWPSEEIWRVRKA